MLEIKIKQMSGGWLLEVRKGKDNYAKVITIKNGSLVHLGIPMKMFVNYITKTLENIEDYLIREQPAEEAVVKEKTC